MNKGDRLITRDEIPRQLRLKFVYTPFEKFLIQKETRRYEHILDELSKFQQQLEKIDRLTDQEVEIWLRKLSGLHFIRNWQKISIEKQMEIEKILRDQKIPDQYSLNRLLHLLVYEFTLPEEIWHLHRSEQAQIKRWYHELENHFKAGFMGQICYDKYKPGNCQSCPYITNSIALKPSPIDKLIDLAQNCESKYRWIEHHVIPDKSKPKEIPSPTIRIVGANVPWPPDHIGAYMCRRLYFEADPPVFGQTT